MNKVVSHILVAAGALGVGGVVGYYVSKKRMEAYVDKEIASVKEVYARAANRQPFASPEDAVQALVPPEEQESFQEVQKAKSTVETILINNGYTQISDGDRVSLAGFEDEPDMDAIAHVDPQGRISLNQIDPETGEEIVEPVEHNLWEDTEPNAAAAQQAAIDPNAQAAADALTESVVASEPVVEVTENPDADNMPPRNPDKPYIITVDEYMSDELHRDDKLTLTFFEEDDTLIDEREQVMQDVEQMVGLENLHHFGLGSRDRNMLYIRNEKMHCDIEIIRDTRSYTEVVLGVKPVKASTRTLRMRDDDL